MSEFQRVSQSEMIATYQRLIEARASCRTDEEREAAQHELTLFIRLMAAGRVQEYFNAKEQA